MKSIYLKKKSNDDELIKFMMYKSLYIANIKKIKSL